MNNIILEKHENLKRHPLYNEFKTLGDIQVFMKYHIFAVWDFMSLLKSLQRQITCVSVPWKESEFSPELVRLVNEIVLGEESDIDPEGVPSSHFSLYMKAMKEIGADTSLIESFLEKPDMNKIPVEIKEAIQYHLNLAKTGSVHRVASSFFYGREKAIPDMFTSMVDIIEENKINCPTLIYYFKRHIELDGEEHGPMAMKCLDQLTKTKEKENEAIETAIDSLEVRNNLWNFILKEIKKERTLTLFHLQTSKYSAQHNNM